MSYIAWAILAYWLVGALTMPVLAFRADTEERSVGLFLVWLKARSLGYVGIMAAVALLWLPGWLLLRADARSA